MFNWKRRSDTTKPEDVLTRLLSGDGAGAPDKHESAPALLERLRAANVSQTERVPAELILADGESLADYLIERQCHVGSLGTLYVAVQQPSNADVLLFSPGVPLLKDETSFRRVLADAEQWRTLGAHPHIVQCLEVLPWNDTSLVAHEYIEGRTLRDWIAEGQSADLNSGLELAIQFGHALEHMHGRGVANGGLTPDNILLARDGTLKLTGARSGRPVAEALSAAPLPALRNSGGVPEQTPSAADDIRDFGLCLYEMFCGRRPDLSASASPPEPRVLRSDIVLPRALCDLMKRCIASDCADRPTPVELVVELCALYETLNGAPTVHQQLPPTNQELSRMFDDATDLIAADAVEDLIDSPMEQGVAAAPVSSLASGTDVEAEIERSIEEFLGTIKEPDAGDVPAQVEQVKVQENAGKRTTADAEQKFSEAVSLNNLADEMLAAGDSAKAASIYSQALAIIEQSVGPNHPYAAVSLKGLADLYAGGKEFAKAEPLYQRLLVLQERVFGADSPNVARTIQKLASIYRMQNRLAEAAALSSPRR